MSQQDMLFILECPVCLQYMSAPIYQCPTGHSICSKCCNKIRKCPTCSVNYYEKQTRNFALEDVSRIVPCPCPNKEYGCSESIEIHNIQTHSGRCRFRPYSCIFIDDNLCDFKGTKQALMEHMRIMHAECSWMRSVSEDRWEEDEYEHEIQVALCFDEMFYFHRRVEGADDDANGIMYWCLQYVGDREDAKKYTYELQIFHDDGRMISFTCFTQAEHLSFDEIIESGHYVGIPIRVLKLFVDNQKMDYLVTIRRST